MKKFWKKGVALGIAFACMGTILSAGGVSSRAAAKELDKHGTYHAAMGIQTCTQVWINRNAYFDKDANSKFGTDEAATLYAADPSGENATYAGEFTDVEIKGNGTYTVSLKDADFAGETDISQLHVATDIPLNDEIKFTDVTFSVNGKKIATFEEGFMEDEEPYLGGGMDLICINHWRPSLVELLATKGVYETAESGCTLLQGNGKESIDITFTISGFDYDNPEAVAATEEPAPTKEPAKDVTGDKANQTEKGSKSGMMPMVGVVAVVFVVSCVFVVIRKKTRNDEEE